MSALPSIIAMKQSPNHHDDLNIAHRPTLRTKLEQALRAAEMEAKQGQWDQDRAARGALRAANIKTQLWLLDRIEEIMTRPSNK